MRHAADKGVGVRVGDVLIRPVLVSTDAFLVEQARHLLRHLLVQLRLVQARDDDSQLQVVQLAQAHLQ